jgi:hypothetical protein
MPHDPVRPGGADLVAALCLNSHRAGEEGILPLGDSKEHLPQEHENRPSDGDANRHIAGPTEAT